MGIQSFFKQRRPRQFEHKLIYWDPKREELAKRVERIRREMIEAGELEPDSAPEPTSEGTSGSSSTPANYDATEQSRGAFVHSTRHLSRQHRRGITSADRSQRIIRLMIALLALGFAFWYFFIR